MKKVLFVTLVTVIAMAMIFANGDSESGSAGSVYTIRITTSQLPTQQMGKGIALLKENLEKELGDRVDVKTYDSASLYSSTEEIGACTRNEIQVAFTTGGSMEVLSEKIQLVKAPFLFPSIQVAYDVLDNSEFATEIFAPVNDAGLTIKGIFSSGNVVLANDKRPLTTPADFVGLKMRAPGTMDSMNLTALGAIAMTTASDETYSAIQQGVIDGMSTPSSVFVPRKFYEIQHYVTDGDNLSMQLGYAIVNTAWYESLPEDIKAGFDAAFEATITQMRADIATSTTNVFAKIESEGCEVHHLTAEEKVVWEQALQVVYTQVAADLGQDIVDLARSCVAESAKKF